MCTCVLWGSQLKEGLKHASVTFLNRLKNSRWNGALQKSRGCKVKPEISAPLDVIIKSLDLSATLSAPHRHKHIMVILCWGVVKILFITPIFSKHFQKGNHNHAISYSEHRMCTLQLQGHYSFCSYREKKSRWSTFLNLYGYHSLGTAYDYLFYNLFTEL